MVFNVEAQALTMYLDLVFFIKCYKSATYDFKIGQTTALKFSSLCHLGLRNMAMHCIF